MRGKYAVALPVPFSRKCRPGTGFLSVIHAVMCRRRSIPLLIIEYDLCDSRVTSVVGIKRQILEFMDSRMEWRGEAEVD